MWGLSYVFFDAYYERVSKFKEDFYRVLKAINKVPSFNNIKYCECKKLPPII